MTKLKTFPRQALRRQSAESAMIRKLEKDPSVNLINNKREMNTIYEKTFIPRVILKITNRPLPALLF